MNAQMKWKHYYRQIRSGLILDEFIEDQRDDMRRYRREAALERCCEAQQRTIEAMQKALENDECIIRRLGQHVIDEA